MTLPTDPKARKAIPVYSGFIKYFPRAICAVAAANWISARTQAELDSIRKQSNGAD